MGEKQYVCTFNMADLPDDESNSAIATPADTGGISLQQSAPKTATAKNALGRVGAGIAIGAAVKAGQITGDLIAFKENTISLRTGATEYEQKCAYIKGEVENATKSIAGGAMAGAVGGPIGMAVGAVVGAISYGIDKGMNYLKNSNKIYLQYQLESITINMQEQRLGSAGSRSSRQ